MSVQTVAWKDLTSVRRSRALWASVTLLALLMAALAYTAQGYQLSPREQVLNLLRMVTLASGAIAPIIALVLSYQAITGERQTGGIKFLLSMPNTRRDVFFGKLASRLLLVSGGFTFVFVTMIAVAVAMHGALPLRAALGVFLISVIYTSVFVAIALALSAAVVTRGRAIAAAITSYFALVLFFIVPGLNVSGIVTYVHRSVLGLAPNPNLYSAVRYISPYTAFQKATNLVFPPAYRNPVFPRGSEVSGLPWYLSDEMSLIVFAVWLAVPLLIGYVQFNRADLE